MKIRMAELVVCDGNDMTRVRGHVIAGHNVSPMYNATDRKRQETKEFKDGKPSASWSVEHVRQIPPTVNDTGDINPMRRWYIEDQIVADGK
jgi:hypothetical protein